MTTPSQELTSPENEPTRKKRFPSLFRAASRKLREYSDERARKPGHTSSLSPLGGYRWHDESGEVSQRWALKTFRFGAIPSDREGGLQTPLLVEPRKPHFVLDSMTTEVDTMGLVIDAPVNSDGSYGAPRTEISLNMSTRESDGREFDSGALDGTANPTGAVRIELDENGQVGKVWLSRNNKTGMSEEKPSPELVGNIQTMLEEALSSVTNTANAYKQLAQDIELAER